MVGDELPTNAMISTTTTTAKASPAAATHRAPNRERVEGGTGVKLPARCYRFRALESVALQERYESWQPTAAAHKTSLHRYPAQQKPRRAVELAEGVVVLVGSSGGRDVAGYVLSFGDLRSISKNPVRQGNLTVYAKPEYAHAVEAALRQLRH